jgi:SAM-dependent methyltransferase
VNDFIKNKNILNLVDFGCGEMPYKTIVTPHVNSYTGVDIPSNRNADLYLNEQGILPLENSFADVIISTQVLEHVPEPKEYLNEAHRVLKSKGLLIISTHGYWMYHPNPNDYWRWTSAGLKKIITESDFEIIRFKGIVGRSAMGLQLFQDGLLFKLPGFIKFLFVPLMQILIMLFDKTSSQKVRDYDACVFIIVAQKK